MWYNWRCVFYLACNGRFELKNPSGDTETFKLQFRTFLAFATGESVSLFSFLTFFVLI